jgi:hypothetical protein
MSAMIAGYYDFSSLLLTSILQKQQPALSWVSLASFSPSVFIILREGGTSVYITGQRL